MADFTGLQQRYWLLLSVVFVIAVLAIALAPTGLIAAGQTVKVGGSKSVAEFYKLDVNVTGLGKVTTSGPSAIACGGTWWKDCSENYVKSPVQTVTLNATPKGGSNFTGWWGACSGNATTCTITMNSAKAVGANFNGGETKQLGTSTKGGYGAGRITSDPPGIDCLNKSGGTGCVTDFPRGELIVLTATPSLGSTFATWSGETCTGLLPTCGFYINNNAAAYALFTKFVVLVDRAPIQPKVGQTVNFTARAGDPWIPAIKEIRVYVDSSASPKKVCTFTSGKQVSVNCVYSTSSLKEGKHTYFATAKNEKGNSVSSGVKTFNVVK